MVVVHIDRGGETLDLRSAVRIGRRGALLATLVAVWVVAASLRPAWVRVCSQRGVGGAAGLRGGTRDRPGNANRAITTTPWD